MNRRKLFGFLAVAPVAGIVSVAKASKPVAPREGRMYLMDDGEWVTIKGETVNKITVINGGPEDTFKTAIWMEPKDRA